METAQETVQAVVPNRSLTWEELRYLGMQYYGLYTFGFLDLSKEGERGDLVNACLNQRMPMALHECNDEQLKIFAQMTPSLRNREYGNPPKKEAWLNPAK